MSGSDKKLDDVPPTYRLNRPGPINFGTPIPLNRLHEVSTGEVTPFMHRLGQHLEATYFGLGVKRSSYQERFDAFVSSVPLEELLEITEGVSASSTYLYQSKALGQEEPIYKSDLPALFAEIRHRLGIVNDGSSR